MSDPVFLPPHQYLVLSLLKNTYFSYSDGSVLISNGDFNLYFPSD